MITDATTTEDLTATFGNSCPIGEVSFEQGCTVLDAIEMFDRRTAGGKLPFVPATSSWDDRQTHQRACEQLAFNVVHWTCRQLAVSALAVGDMFTAWVVIDKATRVAWVECSPVKNQRAQHPRDLREAGEFPSSSRGTVSAHVFLRMGETWREVLDSVLEAYHEAKCDLDGEGA